MLISKQSQQQHQQEDDIVSFTEEIFDPPVSVYKGYSLPEDTEEYSCGLTNAIYTIAAADLKDDIFGKLMHCPFQDPGSLQGEASVMDALKKRSHEVPASDNFGEFIIMAISEVPSLEKRKNNCLGNAITFLFPTIYQ
ncbi:RNase H family protein [Prunus dulcis]|uniref:RNase H family protein n=1 Tax=Prunus dulcis TaxID=3755 RepID=A0A4Y1QUC3_PRUDU|nr:RNase H family protein [Prunus dulcis]